MDLFFITISVCNGRFRIEHLWTKDKNVFREKQWIIRFTKMFAFNSCSITWVMNSNYIFPTRAGCQFLKESSVRQWPLISGFNPSYSHSKHKKRYLIPPQHYDTIRWELRMSGAIHRKEYCLPLNLGVTALEKVAFWSPSTIVGQLTYKWLVFSVFFLLDISLPRPKNSLYPNILEVPVV